jgi:hypothetical protein
VVDHVSTLSEAAPLTTSSQNLRGSSAVLLCFIHRYNVEVTTTSAVREVQCQRRTVPSYPHPALLREARADNMTQEMGRMATPPNDLPGRAVRRREGIHRLCVPGTGTRRTTEVLRRPALALSRDTLALASRSLRHCAHQSALTLPALKRS